MIQITKLLAWVSNIDPSGHFDYPYACIYQLHIEDFVAEIHHGDFLIFLLTSKTERKKQKLAFTTVVHRVVARKP